MDVDLVDVVITDARMLGQFGDPCSAREDCESTICIFAGTTGACSQLCPDGMCPDGWDCLGVEGAVEPGVVSDVCVPENDRLCLPCTSDLTCSSVFPDLCLAQTTGSFCARDCSTVACPTGYTCTTVNIGGTDWEQCLPDSGDCDCGPAMMGLTLACQIPTAFGDCQGLRTCDGSQGWSDCLPPSPTDLPDATFFDANCDGIDGDIAAGIFVATIGADDVGCGLVYTDPCATIGYGVSRAVSEGKGHVYIQAGVYAEVVPLASGVSLWGGYDAGWQRDTRSAPGHEVRITGGLDPVIDQYVVLRAHDLTAAVTVADLVIDAPDGTGTLAGNGRTSYGVHVKGTTGLSLTRLSILAGNGASGPNGMDGVNAPSLTASGSMNGTNGGGADEFASSCDTTSHGEGGNGGSNSCAGGASTTGGGGGDGGEMDTTCTWPGVCDNCNATAGDGGGNGGQYMAGGVGQGGAGGAGGNACLSDPGDDGANGRITNGTAGMAGNGSLLNNYYWAPRAGQAGGTGNNGGGGGGGGGSGGCDLGTDSYGAGGGGGGAGGCMAVSGGGGGGGGGGSFGVFAYGSTVTLADCAFTRGTGGNGGNGGIGGQGQSGGDRGSPGSASGDSAAGGFGGRGSHGGHGGGGGGGAGGLSYGVYSYTSTISGTSSCTFVGGAGGSAGTGGASAPSAPVAERDGAAGGNGSAGVVGDVGTCAATTGC